MTPQSAAAERAVFDSMRFGIVSGLLDPLFPFALYRLRRVRFPPGCADAQMQTNRPQGPSIPVNQENSWQLLCKAQPQDTPTSPTWVQDMNTMCLTVLRVPVGMCFAVSFA